MSIALNTDAPVLQQFASSANFQTYAPAAISAAESAGIDPTIFLSLIGSESSFNPYAYNASGAGGIAQFTPSTADQLGVNPFDPNASLGASANYLSQLFSKYGNYQDAIAAYKGSANNQTAQSQAASVLTNAGISSTSNSQPGFWSNLLSNAAQGSMGDLTPQAVAPSMGAMNIPGAPNSTGSGGLFPQIIAWIEKYTVALIFIAVGLVIVIFSAKNAFTEGKS